MADTIRTLAALQALLADNTAGSISEQDLRDVLLSTYPDNPHGTFASIVTQTIASTTVAYEVALEVEIAKDGLTHSTSTNNSRIQIDTAGTYTIIVSAIADTTGGGSAEIDLWFRVDGADVANSNTIARMANSNTETVVAVALTYTFTAAQYFELVMHGSATTVQLLATAAGTTPTTPVCPSVIVSVTKVSST